MGINRGDSPSLIQAYRRQGGFTFPVAHGGGRYAGSVFERYRVQAFPTNVLIDGEGNIVFRSVGFDAAGLHAALRDLGLGLER